ncbi:MAG: ABC transporter ATP-binding protein [Actinomycetes bacterium]|jgi:ABC-2 type transport system ATP-binding protein|nr:ABC transporter ATP-binding protein [Acidimicrobiia bacterium]
MSEPIVAIEHLGKVYEPFSRGMRLLLRTSVKEPVVALDDVSLEVHPGQIMAVLGPNGAGKSTLFRVLTGLTTPTTGRATIMGLDATRDSAKVRRLIGFMPAENRTLLLRHSCRENLAFHGRLQGIPEAQLHDRIDETLETVGLYEARDRIGFALSSGMLARLMLARAILHEPTVLILDEPTSAVDPLGAFELISMIQRIATERNLAVLISSHRLDEVEMLNDHVVLLNRGRVVYSGHLSSMTAQARRPRIEIVAENESAAEKLSSTLSTIDGIDSLQVEGSSVFVATDLPIDGIVQTLNGYGDLIVSIGRTAPRLRDVLGEMLGSNSEAS